MNKSKEQKHDQCIATVREMARTYKPAHDASWLIDDPSMAFLVCVAMGPWNEKCRFDVAHTAVDWLIEGVDGLDLGNVVTPPGLLNVYPLEWQNTYLRGMVASLKAADSMMHDVFMRWLDILIKGDEHVWEAVLKELFSMCGVKPAGTKVLWLYARDFLKIPAFPIDRRVHRVLAAQGLPTNSWAMTRICEEAGIVTNDLARACFARIQQ